MNRLSYLSGTEPELEPLFSTLIKRFLCSRHTTNIANLHLLARLQAQQSATDIVQVREHTAAFGPFPV